jgi:integrase
MNAIIRQSDLSPALLSAVALWADVSTDAASARRADLLRDKRAALLNADRGKDDKRPLGFFVYTLLHAHEVTPSHVQAWIKHLESQLAPATVYARVSRLSAFYDWLMQEPAFAAHIGGNPVRLARPKAPLAYQSESTQALTDEAVRALLAVVKADADDGDVAAARDYAMLRFYFATGKRRAEVASLTWGDLQVSGSRIVFESRHKGGEYISTEVTDPGVKRALFDYLKASHRWDAKHNRPALQPDDPLWLRHDFAAQAAAKANGGKVPGVTSHGFVKAFKQYAERAGLGDVHLHQTRHTVAALVGEESGDMGDVQQVLGHKNKATTEVYLRRIAVKKDKYSRKIARRLKLD